MGCNLSSRHSYRVSADSPPAIRTKAVSFRQLERNKSGPVAPPLGRATSLSRRGSERRLAVSAEATRDINLAVHRRGRKHIVDSGDTTEVDDEVFRRYAKPREPKSPELLKRLHDMTVNNPLFSGSSELVSTRHSAPRAKPATSRGTRHKSPLSRTGISAGVWQGARNFHMLEL